MIGELRRVLAPWLDRLVGLDGAGRRVVVGCSGGADSLALLGLVCATGLDARALYVDHGLRPGTEHEFEVVGAAARAFGVEADRVRIDVASGANLEARAREARYAALEERRRAAEATAVLVGHTADDQAETMLLNLLRGAASPGLGAMAVRRGHLVRPLLALRRADTREACRRLGLTPVDDPMNHDVRHRRVWLRREVIPRLEAGAGRDLTTLLARQAQIMRDESEHLDAVAAEALAAAGEPPDAGAVATLPVTVARRVVRRWLGEPPVGVDHVDAVLDVAAGGRRAVELPGGRRVVRAGGRLHVENGDGQPPGEPVGLSLPGRAAGCGVEVEAWVESAPPVGWPDGRWTCVADADRSGAEALLRCAEPGDRFRPLGLAGSKLVADALAELGLPPEARRRHAVVSAGTGAAVPPGEPLWVVGYRIDDRVRVSAGTRRFLWLTARSIEGG